MKKVSIVTMIEDPLYWEDGLYQALQHLKMTSTKYQLDICLKGQKTVVNPDIIIAWGGTMSECVKETNQHQGKKILLYAGGPIELIDRSYDLILVEDDYALKEIRRQNIRARIAFGINNEIFYPKKVQSVWKYIYPAAFAKWKRHHLFAIRSEKPALAVGYIQPNGVEEETWRGCIDNGVHVMSRVTPRFLAELYSMSDICYIPAELYGGSQRTVLEARACGLAVIVEDDNPRLKQLLKIPIPTYKDYARELDNAIMEVL